MKRKTLTVLLIVEAAACAAFCLARAEMSGFASSALAFPFAQIAALLRALSLAGRVGNAFAMLLLAAVGLLPAAAVLHAFGKRPLRGSDTLGLLASALLLVSLFLMARPGTLADMFGGMGAELGAAALGTALWSVLAAWAALEALRSMRGSEGAALYRWGRALLMALDALFVFLIFGSGISSLLSSIDAVKAANTAPDVSLAATNVFLVLRAAADALPWALDIAIVGRGLRLLDAAETDRYSAETVDAANALTKLCGAALTAVMLSLAAINIAQLIFSGALRDMSINASFPVFSAAFVFAALILSRLLGENKALKDEGDLFV